MRAIIIILLFLFSLCDNEANSQNSFINGRNNIKVGVSYYPPLQNSNNYLNWRAELNHGFTRFLEAGAYLGYSKFYAYPPGGGGGSAPTPFYGITANFHLLPLIVKQRDFRFDFYLSGKFGGNYYFTPDKDWTPARGHRTEYGLGLGLSFYVFKKLGFFTEYTIGHFSYFDNLSFSATDYYDSGIQTNFRFGLTYKYSRMSHLKQE